MLELGQIEDVRGNKIRWIKALRQITGGGLAQCKFFFDLLYERGYDLNDNASLLPAAVIYSHWLDASGRDHDEFLNNIHRALVIVRRGDFDNVAATMATEEIFLAKRENIVLHRGYNNETGDQW